MLFFLRPLGHPHQLPHVVPHRTAGEQDDALPLVLVLTVLQSEGGRFDAGEKVRGLAGDADVLGQRGHDLTRIAGGGDVHLDAVAGQREETDCGLRVALDLGSGQKVHRLLLRVETRRGVVAVAAPLAVVNTQHDGLEHHGWGGGRRRAKCSDS